MFSRAALLPEEFPDEIFEEHGEAIAAGVISAMMLMPGKPWTQRESALTYGRTYGSAVRDTRGRMDLTMP